MTARLVGPGFSPAVTIHSKTASADEVDIGFGHRGVFLIF